MPEELTETVPEEDILLLRVPEVLAEALRSTEAVRREDQECVKLPVPEAQALPDSTAEALAATEAEPVTEELPLAAERLPLAVLQPEALRLGLALLLPVAA